MKKYKQDNTRRTRNKSYCLKLTTTEKEKLKRIAKELGTTQQDFLISYINSYYE